MTKKSKSKSQGAMQSAASSHPKNSESVYRGSVDMVTDEGPSTSNAGSPETSTARCQVPQSTFRPTGVSWADDVEKEEAAKLERDRKKAKKARMKTARLDEVHKRRRDGLPPLTPCPKGCAELHWKEACPKFLAEESNSGKRKRSVKEGKPKKGTKKTRDDSERAVSHPKRGSSHRTEMRSMTVRAARGIEAPVEFGDGTHGFVTIPADRRDPPISMKELADSMKASMLVGMVRFHKSGSKGWAVKFDSAMRLREAVNKKSFNLLQGGVCRIAMYHSSGPRAFYCANIGNVAISDNLLARSVSEALGGKVALWLGREKYEGIAGPAALILMKLPFDRFQLQIPLQFSQQTSKRFSAKFVIAKSDSCDNCRTAEHGTQSCPLLVGVEDIESDLRSTILSERPVL